MSRMFGSSPRSLAWPCRERRVGGARLRAQQSRRARQNALQGFSQNKDQPIHIEAATLEVHDKAKTATFSGNVQVVQGDTTMRCKRWSCSTRRGRRGHRQAGGCAAADGPAAPGMPQGAQDPPDRSAGGVTVVPEGSKRER